MEQLRRSDIINFPKAPVEYKEKVKIIIVGKNDLIANMTKTFIEEKLQYPCTFTSDLTFSFLNKNPFKNDHISILMLDCHQLEPEIILNKIDFLTLNYPSVFVVLFNLPKDTLIQDMIMGKGVRGIFYEDDRAELFLKGISAIIEGKLWFSRDVMMNFIMNKRSKINKNKDTSALTSREKEILALIAVGLKNEEIADKLCISPHTVKTHIYNIFQKIKVSNRIQAAFWALKHL
jgi:DNA-binding NarL/FixJ family response regulator